MKKVIISGILAIVSSIWAIAIGVYVQFNLASTWYGNRFWSSAIQLGVIVPLVISLVVLALSIAIMCVEYFHKDR